MHVERRAQLPALPGGQMLRAGIGYYRWQLGKVTAERKSQRRTKASQNQRGITQADLAKKIGSSQSRIAKAEASDPSVSVDLLMRALLATGATLADLGRMITGRRRKEAV